MQRPQFPTTLLHFVWCFLKQFKMSLFIFAIVSIIWSTEMSLSPYLLKLIIDGANKTSDHPELLISVIAIPVIIYSCMSIIINITFRIYGITCLRLFPVLKEQMISSVFAYLSQHSYRYFQEHFSGTLTSKLSDLGQGIEPLIQIPNEIFIPRILAIIIASVMFSLVQPLFSFFLLCWGIVFIIVTFYFARMTEEKATVFAESYTELNGRISDSISNMITSKIFANEKYEYKRIRKTLQNVAVKDRAMQWQLQVSHFIQGIFVTILIVGMLSLLIIKRKQGLVTVGDFAFVISLSIMILIQIWDFGKQLVLFMKEIGKCKQALSIITEPIEIKEYPHAKAIQITQGMIVFDHVNFSYSEEVATLKNIFLTIQPGEKVGLVGFSGGGKSTFVKLILRLFDLYSGKILIDNQNIQEVTKSSLRQQIAIIPQDPELFHRSIYENIEYGNLSATKEDIIEAAKRAHCHEFIMEIKDDYQALVGEKGVKLSGGQRQRIAIARAFLKQAPIIILDEATSALDSETERYIQKSLHEIMLNKTTIVIAHRLSTLLEMDRVLFFKDGEIVEDGTLAELKRKKGYFAKLWKMQGDGYLPELYGARHIVPGTK